jgi:hypothetical protein
MVRAHTQCIMYTDYVTVWQVCEVWFYIKWNIIYMTILKKLCIMYFTLFATLDFTLYISYKTTFFQRKLLWSHF